MDMYFHFPPDLFNILVDTIPRLNKTKKDLLINERIFYFSLLYHLIEFNKNLEDIPC